MRYILGTISEEEKTRLEESYFVDDAEFEEFEIAEDELIDRYVRSELSREESERLEKTLATSPRLIERVQFARVMAGRLAPESAPAAPVETRSPVPEKTSWWQGLFGFPTASRAPAMALSFSVLLLLAGGTTLLVAYLNLREQSRLLAAQQAALEQRQRELDKQAADLKAKTDELASQFQLPSPTPAPSQQPTPETPTRAVLALTLPAGTTRSTGSSNSIQLHPETSELQLNLNLRDTNYSSYRATLTHADRGEITYRRGLRPQVTRRGAVLSLRLPAKQLIAGDYIVSVHGITASGSEPVDDYTFRVLK